MLSELSWDAIWSGVMSDHRHMAKYWRSKGDDEKAQLYDRASTIRGMTCEREIEQINKRRGKGNVRTTSSTETIIDTRPTKTIIRTSNANANVDELLNKLRAANDAKSKKQIRRALRKAGHHGGLKNVA